jgi:histone acetyltransferase HTATIP
LFPLLFLWRSYQRKGYGKFLIEFSYALSKIEGKVGSPEKPLSDLGQLAYYPYWEEQLLLLLADNERSGQEISVMDICNATSFKPDDVLGTLKRLNLLRYHNGQHVLLLNDDAKKLHDKKLAKIKNSKKPRVKPELIHWIPIIEYGAKGRDKWAFKSKQLSSLEGVGMGEEGFGLVSES